MNKTTKTAQFTPGPLHLNGTYLPTGDGIGDGNNAYICTADGRQLAQMYRKHPQAQAYAPMLAAAPEMYMALQAFIKAVSFEGGTESIPLNILIVADRAKDALAQANALNDHKYLRA